MWFAEGTLTPIQQYCEADWLVQGQMEVLADVIKFQERHRHQGFRSMSTVGLIN